MLTIVKWHKPYKGLFILGSVHWCTSNWKVTLLRFHLQKKGEILDSAESTPIGCHCGVHENQKLKIMTVSWAHPRNTITVIYRESISPSFLSDSLSLSRPLLPLSISLSPSLFLSRSLSPPPLFLSPSPFSFSLSLSLSPSPVWLKDKPPQSTTNHHKPPQTTTNHRKPPHTTANHHKPPPEFGTIIRRYDRVPLKKRLYHRKPPQTTANHRKPPPEFGFICIHVLVKSKYLLNYNRFSN